MLLPCCHVYCNNRYVIYSVKADVIVQWKMVNPLCEISIVLPWGLHCFPFILPSALCDKQMASHDQEGHVGYHFHYLKKCSGAIVDTFGMWCWSQWCHMTKRDVVHIIFSCLYLKKTVMPFMMLLASCNTDTDPSGIMWHQHQWYHLMPMLVAVMSHGEKSHVTSNFDCLDLGNVMVTLRMLIASHGTNTSVNGMT